MGSRLAAQGKNGRAAKDEILFCFLIPEIWLAWKGTKRSWNRMVVRDTFKYCCPGFIQ